MLLTARVGANAEMSALLKADSATARGGSGLKKATPGRAFSFFLDIFRLPPACCATFCVILCAAALAGCRGGPLRLDRLDGQLLNAAKTGDAALMRVLLDEGAHIEAHYQDGSNALLLAAARGHAQAVQLLIERGANIETRDIRDDAPVILAAACPQTDALQALLDHGANAEAKDELGDSALIEAARDGNFAGVALLLQHVKTIQAEEKDRALFAAAEGGPPVEEPDAKAVAAQQINSTAASTVQERPGNFFLGTIDLLLKNGANVDARDADGSTPLMWAAAHGRAEIASEFLAAGANIEGRDNAGDTALIAAACDCAVVDMPDTFDAVRLLLAKDANVEARNNRGQTALLRAAEWGRAEIASALLAAGAKIEDRDNQGNTPLMLAASGGALPTVDAVKLLLQRGANVAAKNSAGETALDLAIKRASVEVVKLLQRAESQER